MQFDPENKINKLCAEGIHLEGENPEKAHELYLQAWDEASNSVERFTAAHYLARMQKSIPDKLKWDTIALEEALASENEHIEGTLPSLYLNIAKCFEDLQNSEKAKENYQLALSFSGHLQDDAYGNLIKNAIQNGISRITTE